MSFAEILDAVDVLPIDEKIEISRLIQLRLIEQKRELLSKEILEANEEFKMGLLQVQSVDSIMDDILNEL